MSKIRYWCLQLNASFYNQTLVSKIGHLCNSFFNMFLSLLACTTRGLISLINLSWNKVTYLKPKKLFFNILVCPKHQLDTSNTVYNSTWLTKHTVQVPFKFPFIHLQWRLSAHSRFNKLVLSCAKFHVFLCSFSTFLNLWVSEKMLKDFLFENQWL